jgi:hypothetical protein
VTSNPATTADAHALWPDSSTLDEPTLLLLLDGAWLTCSAYLPADVLESTTSAPPTWTEAVVLQARDVWSAFLRTGDVVGFESYAVRVRPLSDSVAALLRPRRGRPLVG